MRAWRVEVSTTRGTNLMKEEYRMGRSRLRMSRQSSVDETLRKGPITLHSVEGGRSTSLVLRGFIPQPI